MLALLVPRLWHTLRSRQGTVAKSNGLPLHSSRGILRRSQIKPAEEEEEAAVVPSDTEYDDFSASYMSGYPISSAQANYAYHTPTDDEYTSISTPYEVVPRQGKNRVRRVSRGEHTHVYIKNMSR